MIPTSEPLAKWLSHIGGEVELRPKERRRILTEAVDLNKEAQEIVSTFGQKEFPAVVGFIDMQRFSEKAHGKLPREVLEIAKPFIEAVIAVAKNRQWFVDKTVGDEVMVICPFFGQDACMADEGLMRRDPDLLEVSGFVSDLIQEFINSGSIERFSAGFAVGKVILDRVGTAEYSEWTCYGNVVNTAKRLQDLRPTGPRRNINWMVTGANRQDSPDFESQLEEWIKICTVCGKLNLLSPLLSTKTLKGVGETVYVSTMVELKVSEG